MSIIVLVGACGQKSPQALLESGKELEAKGDSKGALIQYKAALQLDASSGEARWLLGKLLLAMGDPQAAASELARAKEAGRPSREVVPVLAKAMLGEGEAKRLIQTLGAVHLDDKIAQAELLSHVAAAWAGLGDHAKAEATINSALAEAPDSPTARLFHARVQADKGNLKSARSEADEVLKAHPALVDAWFLRGQLARVEGDIAGAAEAFQKAVGLDKSHVGSYAALVSIRLEANDLDGARKLGADLREAVPGHPVTALVDAELAYLSEDYPKARERVQKLLAAFPERLEIVVLAGLVEARMGALVQAAALLGKAVSANPAQDRARIGLAEVEVRLGRYSRALETLRPMLAAKSPNPVAQALAGQAELRLGNEDAADKYFQAAASSSPNNTRLQVLNLSRKLSGGDSNSALASLQTLASQSKETYADQALFAAHMKRRDFDAALSTLDSLAKKDPSVAGNQELRGRVYLAKRDVASARAAFEAAVKADPGLFGAVAMLVSLDLADKKPDAAVQRLQAVISARPGDSLALMALGEVKARHGGSTAEVRQLFQDAAKAAPTSADPRLKLIDLALRKRQFKDALVFAQEALSALPNDTQVMTAAGKAQFQAGDHEQAVATFRRLAGALPKAGGPYLLLSQVYKSQGKMDAAENAISKALELEPDSVEAQIALVDALSASNRKGRALEYARRIQQSRPRSAVGYALEAAVHGRQKEVDAAISVLRDGVSKTASGELAGRLYSLYVEQKRMPEASRFADQWLKQHPDDAGFEYLVAVTDIFRGDNRTAEVRLRRVVAAYPKNALALNNLAWILVQRKDKAALEYAQRATDILPDRPPFMDTLAQALAMENRLPAALDMQRAAVELDPQDYSLRLNLARLALQAGDKNLARDELRLLEKLGSKFEAQDEVSRLLKQI